MRLLSKVWKATEVVKNDSSGEMTLPLEEVATNLYKSVIFLGHAFQSAAYYRRYNALSSVMKDHKNLQETKHRTSNAIWRNGHCSNEAEVRRIFPKHS